MRCNQAGFLASTRPVEIGELADVMNLQVRPGVADLAVLGEEPMDQLVAPSAGDNRLLVGEDGRALSLERDPAEAGDQWLPAPIAVDGDLEACARSVGCLDRRLVLSSHL